MPIFKPDNYEKDPYGFTTNQISHTMAIGFLGLVYLLTLMWYWIWGEFPQKEAIIAIAGVGYLAYEIADQGWHGWDTIEDWWFVNVYGVWAPVLTFSEVEPGSPELTGNLLTGVPFLVLFVLHIGLGAWVRKRRTDKGP